MEAIAKRWTAKEIGRLAFPDYRGRKIREEVATRPIRVESYWDGGSRDYFVCVDLRSGRVVALPQNGTPYDGGPIAPKGVMVPEWGAIVERSYFCGKDVGIMVHWGSVPTIEAR